MSQHDSHHAPFAPPTLEAPASAASPAYPLAPAVGPGDTLPPPAAPTPSRRGKARRPQVWIVGAALVLARLGREVLGRSFGVTGVLIGFAVFVALVVGWRLWVRQRGRRSGVAEFTPEMIAKQFARSGAAAPAFPEDGTLLGASLFAVNQRSKLIEVVSEYEVFASNGAKLGHVHQIGQGRFKRVVRFFGSLDQFFTHHFDITDADDRLLLRVSRPRKWFKSRVEVFDAYDRFIGRIVQRNVFGKIDFGMYTPSGELVGLLRAENWRAWDFRVETPTGFELARITKTWEGLARTVFTSADTYVVRINQQVADPLRALVFVAALTVDVALKQDARGFGA